MKHLNDIPVTVDVSDPPMRIGTRVRRSVGILAAVGVTLVAMTAAFAAFSANGNGTGSATTGTVQAVTAADGAVVSNLIPDGTPHDVTLTVTNPNSFAVTLKSVTANGPVTAANDCSPTGVTLADQMGLSILVPGGNVPTPVTLIDAAVMDNTSASACQGTTFTIPVTISVQR